MREWVWRSLGYDLVERHELPDDVAALALVEAAADRLAGLLELPTSRRRVRVRETEVIIESPTRSRRYGAQLEPERNLRAYLLAEVLGLSLAELGERLGITKAQAWRAKQGGAASVAKIARSRTDPRRPSLSGRPAGRNERAW